MWSVSLCPSVQGYEAISEKLLQVNTLKQISFKEIIQHYKKQPQCKTDIFRTVVIHQANPELVISKTGDIIEFYNVVFIPAVKAFVLRLGSRKVQLVGRFLLCWMNLCSCLKRLSMWQEGGCLEQYSPFISCL